MFDWGTVGGRVLCASLVFLAVAGASAQQHPQHHAIPDAAPTADPASPASSDATHLAQFSPTKPTTTAPVLGAPALPAGCEPHSPVPAPGGRPEAGNKDPNAALPNDLVAYQQFPPAGDMRTAWFVTFNHQKGRGLFITRAYFKPAPDRPWIKVLHRAEVSEIFVPYQSGRPRYQDFAEFGFGPLTATDRDRGRCGAFVTRTLGGGSEKVPVVVREVTDKGVLWKRDENVYRGHKMTLWATVGADNYNYIISYAFHDDGYIEFRGGATSQNLPTKPSEPHLHNFFWRIDVDINGSTNNVTVLRHLENVNQQSWQDCEEAFNNNREGPLSLNPREFTMLHVTGQGMAKQHAGYMVMPIYRGQQRHNEAWTRSDIWVTKYRQDDVVLRIQNIQRISRGEPIANEDVVLWVSTPLLHLPRTEDGRCLRMSKDKEGRPLCVNWHGSATIMWAGVDMKPHNLFETTPMFAGNLAGAPPSQTAYHPPRCQAGTQPTKRSR